MGTESGTVGSNLAASEVAEKLRQEPFSFYFFQAVRLLERFYPERPSVGQFAHPDTEVARFSVHPSLAFPASQIQSMDWPNEDEKAVQMTVNFMGLTGPQGVLPNPYTTVVPRFHGPFSNAAMPAIWVRSIRALCATPVISTLVRL